MVKKKNIFVSLMIVAVSICLCLLAAFFGGGPLFLAAG